VRGQDAIVANGPQQLLFGQAGGQLPITDLPDFPGSPDPHLYHGETPQFSQNVQFDHNGDLLFFVIDGRVYDREGYMIADDRGTVDCEDCLFRGISQVAITLVPGSCSQYYLVAADFQPTEHALGYSILDMGQPNRYWPNRTGRVLSYNDVANDPGLTAQFSNAYQTMPLWSEHGNGQFDESDRMINLDDLQPNSGVYEYGFHLAIYDTDRANEEKVLFAVDEAYLYYCTILPNGIERTNSLTQFQPLNSQTSVFGYGNRRDHVGGCAFQRTGTDPNDPVLFAMSATSLSQTGGPVPSVILFQVDFALNTVEWLQDVTTCQLTGPDLNITGLAFSPNADHLYVAQSEAPWLVAIDLGTYAVTDLATSLGIANPQQFSGATLSIDNSPLGGSDALIALSSSRTAFKAQPDQPTLPGSWNEPIPVTATLGARPTFIYPDGATPSCIPDMHNQGEQQIATLNAGACCVYTSELDGIPGHTFQSNNCTPLVWDQYSLLFGGGTTFTFSGDVIVPAGCQLQVTGKTLRFTPNARLIIKAGGSARFTNCTLTSLTCPGLRWPGVTVEGTTSADQYPLICGDQGFLDLKSTTISNAERGARCATEGIGGALLASGYGGVIYSSGSTFLNCIIGADLGDYHANFVGGVEDNLCYFSNTKFTIDNTWPDASQPSVQLYIHRTRKIRVFQCGFANDATTSIAGLGFGVVAQDAEVSVLGSILPNTSYVRNLIHGVWKFGGVLAPLTVNGMKFSNNQIGIRDDAGHWSRYTNNTFSVPDQNNYPQPRIGMQLWQSRFFTVERNTFTGQDQAIQPNENSIGIFFAGINPDQSTSWVYDDEQIYDNDFTDLYVGSLVNGIHRSDDGTQEDLGLRIFCGEYTNNVMDIGLAARSIIRPNQYDNNPPQLAGNRFYGAADCTNEFDWILDDNWNQNVGAYNNMVITYLHHEDPLCFATCPDPVNDDFVDNPLLFSGLFVESNACGNGVLDLLHSPLQARQAYTSAKQLCLEAKNLLDGATDGGERPDLIAELSQVDPALGTGFLRDRLMLNSPLSNAVLKAMILRELPMDPWHITQVCLENSPLDPGILELIRDQGHLDNFFMNVVDQAQSGQGPSAKQVLQQEWMLRRSQKARAFSELGWLWATDTVTPGGDDSLRFALENHGGLDHTWSRLALRLAEGDLAGASALLGTMRDDQSGMPQLQAVIGFGYACNNDWALLDNASVDLMIAFASSGVQGAAIYAGILSAHGLANVEPEVRFPNSERAMVLAPAGNSGTGATMSITAYPTPADEETWLTFPTELKGMRFQVRDVQGKLVYEGRFESAGLHRLRTREFADGVYSIVPVGSSISGRVLVQH
jgi:hypothetical protein